MSQPFTLAVCAEMLWLDKPLDWRCARLHEMGFHVGLWSWQPYDLAKLKKTGAAFSIINGHFRGGLADDEGAEELLITAKQTLEACKQLGVQRYNVLGSALNSDGHAEKPSSIPTGEMWLKARETLLRVRDLAEQQNVVFALENLNVTVDHPGVPFARAKDTIALVSSINSPHLKLNLDLYHVQIDEGSLIDTCRSALPWIGEIQVADVPGRFEPGTGEVNFAGVARALDKMGYRGPIAMEAWASGTAEDALAAFRAAFTI